MKRKDKLKGLNYLLEENKKEGRIRKCKVCGEKFEKDSSRWSVKKEKAKNKDFTNLDDWETCCILCKAESNDGGSDYFNEEEKEELKMLRRNK